MQTGRETREAERLRCSEAGRHTDRQAHKTQTHTERETDRDRGRGRERDSQREAELAGGTLEL